MTRAEGTNTAYGTLAPYYDLIYGAKNFRREAEIVRRLAREYGPTDGRALLDVACGTGEHLRFLQRWFDVCGIDGSPAMLAVARKKLPGVPLTLGRMEAFRTRRKFDVLTCLFSAIGYLTAERAILRAFRRFHDALVPGGVALVEPFISPDRWRPSPDHPYILDVRGEGVRVLRANVSETRRGRAVMPMHYLVADRAGVRHYFDLHVCHLLPTARLCELLGEAGFTARVLPRAMPSGRGLLVGVRNS